MVQVPDAQGAFVAVDPQDGAIAALTGGFDYFASNYNRAVQAKRQPGSSFKPFLYSAALDQGFTPASIVNDAPLVIEDPTLEGSWRPQNNTREFRGPMRLREALVRSRNLVSIRVMNSLGPAYATQYIERFGFPKEQPAAQPFARARHGVRSRRWKWRALIRCSPTAAFASNRTSSSASSVRAASALRSAAEVRVPRVPAKRRA